MKEEIKVIMNIVYCCIEINLKFILCFALFVVGCSGMQAQSFEKLVKDLDGDQKQDTVYLDEVTSCIVCKLSSREYEPIESLPIEVLNFNSGVDNTDGGFSFCNHWMRAGYYNYFQYERETQRIRLIAMMRYEFGNVFNDGSGESGVNLLTNEYTGSWSYYDVESDELVKMPTIETEMQLPTTYLETFSEESYFEFAEKCAQLFHQQKERMQSQSNFGFSTHQPFPFIFSFPEIAYMTLGIKGLVDTGCYMEKHLLSDEGVYRFSGN